ncbi:MAG: SpoIIE family protein phosphatase [Spirochaetes bacterium]|nr:SpoIIE family protein phosphatase [Spirochaetota bacterium]
MTPGEKAGPRTPRHLGAAVRWMDRCIDRLLHRYENGTYTSMLKARFILYICAVSLVVIPIIIAYTAWLQLQDPAYHYSIEWLPLMPIFGVLVLMVVYTVLLVKGYFRIAAHGILLMLMALVWVVVFMDRSDPISRLDTVVIIFSLMAAAPLAATRRPAAILFYGAFNAVMLFLFLMFQDARIDILYVTYYDYLFDNMLAIFFITIFSYNLFMISRRALDQSEEQKRTLEDMNEDLHVMNTMLQISHDRSIAEIELAGVMQGSIFPESPPLSTGWDIAFAFRPASSVSGDFYDFYFDDRGLRGISLFDVSGHGVAAGLITMIAKPILYRKFSASDDMSLTRMMEGVSESIVKEMKNLDSFITGMVIRFREGHAEYVNAGHHDLLVKRAGSGLVKPVAPRGRDFRSGPIGIPFPAPQFSAVRFRVDRGDVLCLMTDGILEGRNGGREKYGRERMTESLREAPAGTAREILDHVVGRFTDFMEGKKPHDDYTIIIAKKDR